MEDCDLESDLQKLWLLATTREESKSQVVTRSKLECLLILVHCGGNSFLKNRVFPGRHCLLISCLINLRLLLKIGTKFYYFAQIERTKDPIETPRKKTTPWLYGLDGRNPW